MSQVAERTKLAFTVPHDIFRGLVDRVGRIVEKRNTIPILGNVVVRAEGDGRLSIRGTDLDIWAEATAPAATATVRTPGATTVPSGLLEDILRKLGGGDIAFTSDDGGQATIAAGRSRFKLHELPIEDLPDVQEIAHAVAFDLEPDELRRIWKKVGFAISTEETRYYLNGIHFHRDEETGRLVTVATDGHRLSWMATHLGAAPQSALDESMPAIIVPAKTCRQFEAIADGCADGETVRIRANTSTIEFETRGFRLTSKLIDGTFPDYRRVIPTANEHCAMLDPAELAKAVDRVTTVSAERGRAVKFAFAGEIVTMEVVSPDAGDARDEIAIGPHEGAAPEIEIGFNGRYVLDALGTFEEARITIAMHDAGSPAVIKALGGPDRLVVLMPMRV